MWTCPQCGRTFKNTDQHHFCGGAPKTIDEYILAQDEGARAMLQAVREAIRVSRPEAQERISWSMPTYWQGHNIIHFAAQKKACIPGLRLWSVLRMSWTRPAADTARAPSGSRIPIGCRWTW